MTDNEMREALAKLKQEIVGIQHRCKSPSGYAERERGDRMMALFNTIEQALQSRLQVSAMGKEEIAKIINETAQVSSGQLDEFTSFSGLENADEIARALIAAGFGRQDDSAEREPLHGIPCQHCGRTCMSIEQCARMQAAHTKAKHTRKE
jgi:hypothetical protein